MTDQGPGAVYAPSAEGFRLRAWLIPGVLLLVLVVMLAGVILVAGRSGDSGAPPQPAAFATPVASFSTVTLDVQQVAADGRITFANDQGLPDELAIPAGARVEVLTPIEFADVPVGASVSLVGKPNDVRSFVISSVVVFAEDTVSTGNDAGVRSQGGFEGWEAGRDSVVRVILSGTVTSAGADEFVLESAAGPIRVNRAGTEAPFGLPVYLLSEAGVDVIRAGARVAFPAVDSRPDPNADAVLVLPR